jgi:hypothetical protein
MVVLMTALPNTQLTRRLEKEGRLTPAQLDTTGDPLNGGLNFVTLRPRREILRDYKAVLQNIYQPDAFFERVKFVGRTLDIPKHMIMSSFKGRLHDFKIFCRVMWRMSVKRPELRRYFWRTLYDCVRHNPGSFKSVIALMTFYLHLTGFMNSRAKAWAVISG